MSRSDVVMHDMCGMHYDSGHRGDEIHSAQPGLARHGLVAGLYVVWAFKGELTYFLL